MKVYLREFSLKDRQYARKWYVSFLDDNKKRKQLAVGVDDSVSEKAAKKLALEVYKNYRDNPPPAPEPVNNRPDKTPAKMTIKAALDEYERYLKAKGSDWSIVAFKKRLVGDHPGFGFGPKTLCNEVTQRDIDRLVLDRTEEGLSPAYLHHEVSVLRAAVTRAGFDFPRLRRGTLPASKEKTRILTMDEYHRLMEVLTPQEWVTRKNFKGTESGYKNPVRYLKAQQDVKDLALFLFMSGARWGELCAVKWADINFANREVRIGTLKQKGGIKTRWVGMPDELHDVLQRRWLEVADVPNVGTKPVFPGRNGKPRSKSGCDSLDKAIKFAGLNDDPDVVEQHGTFSVHGCRHQNGTWLVQHGLPLPAVSKLLGHSNITMTMRYVNLDHRQTVAAASSALSAISSSRSETV